MIILNLFNDYTTKSQFTVVAHLDIGSNDSSLQTDNRLDDNLLFNQLMKDSATDCC